MGIYDYLKTFIRPHHSVKDIQEYAQRYISTRKINGIVDLITETAWEPEDWVHTNIFWSQIYQTCADQLDPAIRNWILLKILNNDHPGGRIDF